MLTALILRYMAFNAALVDGSVFVSGLICFHLIFLVKTFRIALSIVLPVFHAYRFIVFL